MTNQIKTITLNTGTWVLVTIPKEQSYFDLYEDKRGQYLQYNTMPKPGQFKAISIQLPAGHTYTLIGKASELTEEQKEEIVEYSQLADADDDHDGGYMDYLKSHWGKTNPVESFESLLKSQGMDIETTVILKQND